MKSSHKRFLEVFSKPQSYFLVLVFLLICINVPFWNHSVWWPGTDTALAGESFYTFYSEFFLHGELLRWLPYGHYGIQADHWQLFDLSPMSYLTGLMGWIFRAKNALLLFKITLFFEQVLLLFGCFLLSEKLFKFRSTVFFVCLAVIGTTMPLIQVFWNFRIFYLFPLVLYLLYLSFEKGKPHYLWWAGTVEIFSLTGSLPYYGPIHLLIALFFCVAFYLEFRPRFVFILERSAQNLIFFILMLAVGAVFLYLEANMLNGIAVESRGRNALSHVVRLEDFLSYGPYLSPASFLGFLFPGVIHQFSRVTPETQLLIYIGALPFFFVFYASVSTRSRLAILFGSIVLLLSFFSLSTTSAVSKLFYYLFPPLSLFRSLGMLKGILRLFLLFFAGFGLDQFLKDAQNLEEGKEYRALLIKFYLCVAVASGLLVFLDMKYLNAFAYLKEWIQFHHFQLGIFFLFLLFCALRLHRKIRMGGAAAIFFLALNVLPYQGLVYASWPKNPSWSELGRVQDYAFQMQRGLNYDLTKRSMMGLRQVQDLSRTTVEPHNYIQYDPCFQVFTTSFQPEAVTRLNHARWNLPSSKPAEVAAFFRDPETLNFLQVVGCATPKVKIIPDALFASDQAEALHLIKTVSDFGRTVVIEDRTRQGNETLPAPQAVSASNEVSVISFSFNELVVRARVSKASGAWLYYADTYHPGWKAWMDGEEVPIYRANLAFKAIQLAPGTHTVCFRYFDSLRGVASYMLAFLSIAFGITLVLVILLWLAPFFKPSS